MPYTWLGFSTMSAPAIQGRTPREIREIAREVAERSGGTLIEVYFDVGQEVAYALFKDLGGSAETKRASRELGGVSYTKLLDADQADNALKGAAS
jgi:hypothetical protein